MRRPLLCLAVGMLACTLGGCAYTEGGPGASIDQHTYVSTSWRPVTISLLDTRTGQTFWSVDVPVGKQVVLAFRKDQGAKNTAAPDLMKWEIMDDDASYGALDNSLAVPGKDDRKLVVSYRAAPELPPEMGGGPAKPPSTSKTTQPNPASAAR